MRALEVSEDGNCKAYWILDVTYAGDGERHSSLEAPTFFLKISSLIGIIAHISKCKTAGFDYEEKNDC